MILGTAGHIDHGKTTLVQALTGINTDRLKEEQSRGITIELGFAHLDVSGTRVGIIDVPGHERFVRHMVAGAGGLDMVMMIIAADEGIMPQTREHLEICQLMGVEEGLVVLTKVDLVDEEWLELVQEEIKEELVGSFLEGAQIVPFSALDERRAQEARSTIFAWLKKTLQQRGKSARRIARLPVDRVFTMKGFGTVVTGTLLGGTYRLGDEVELIPGGRRSKIRKINIHSEDVDKASPGHRTALNLAGLSRDEVSRGQVVVPPGLVQESECFDVELKVLEHVEKGVLDRASVLVHTLTHQALGRVVLLDAEQILPGETALAQIRCDSPTAIISGDLFVLRGFENYRHHGKTLAGGRVLDPKAPRFRRKYQDAHLMRLKALASGEVEAALMAHLDSVGFEGLAHDELALRVPFNQRQSQRALDRLQSQREVIRLPGLSGQLFSAQGLLQGEAEIKAILAGYHQVHPEEPGMNKEGVRSALGQRLDQRIFSQLISRMLSQGALVREGEFIRLASFTPIRDDALDEAIIERYRGAGLAGFSVESLEASLGKGRTALRAAARRLMDQRLLTRVKPDYLVFAEALQELRGLLVKHFDGAETLSPGELRDATGLTRKHLIPLLEYLDRIAWTRREESLRREGGSLRG